MIFEIFRVYWWDGILIQDAARGCYPEPGLFTELGFHWAYPDYDNDFDDVFADDDDGNVFDNLFAKTSIIQKNVKFYLQTFFKFDFHCFQIFSLLQGIFFVKAFHEQFTSDILPDSEDDDDADVERWSLINGRLSFRKLGF